jgi:hypothetical protein
VRLIFNPTYGLRCSPAFQRATHYYFERDKAVETSESQPRSVQNAANADYHLATLATLSSKLRN